ncbi:hypothetical protein ABTY96_46850, partial [Streptomyces sp. NPDC096057]|uniref:hypothetical protein n=1 Tax=Streptomyces sp. NPDC096057 TaxID=3155543 RepID=UPI00331E623F
MRQGFGGWGPGGIFEAWSGEDGRGYLLIADGQRRIVRGVAGRRGFVIEKTVEGIPNLLVLDGGVYERFLPRGHGCRGPGGIFKAWPGQDRRRYLLIADGQRRIVRGVAGRRGFVIEKTVEGIPNL